MQGLYPTAGAPTAGASEAGPLYVGASFAQSYDIEAGAPTLVGASFAQTYVIEAYTLVGTSFPQTYEIESDTTMAFVPSAVRTLKPVAGSKSFLAVGPFWDVTDPTHPVGFKDPNDTIDITLDWSLELADMGDDTIASVEFAPSAGLISGGEFAAGALTTIFLDGGPTSGEVECTVTITTGSTPPRKRDRTFYLTMYEG